MIKYRERVQISSQSSGSFCFEVGGVWDVFGVFFFFNNPGTDGVAPGLCAVDGTFSSTG